MRKIKLTQNQFALVDNKDYKNLNKFKWSVLKQKKIIYASRNIKTIEGKHTTTTMHREIMNPPKGMETDHIDGNGLNNQRKNLRICTHSQNQHNRGKYDCNKSGYKGVCWHKKDKKWRASIKNNGKVIFLGRYNSKVEAYKVYCDACKKYHGEFSKIK